MFRPFVFIFAVVCVVLLVRTTGVHFDENNYLRAAFHDSIGDARGYTPGQDGKPPLFYALDYALNHTVGFLFGPWRYLTPLFVYALLNSWALAWLARRLFDEKRKRWLFALLVGLSPFFLFNSTQVMMETPILALECLLLGAILPGLATPAGLVQTTLILLMMMKESALPGIVALGGALWFWRPLEMKRGAKLLAVALAVAWSIKKVCRVGGQTYGGIGFLLDPSRWASRLGMSHAYLGNWFFFVGPLLVLVAFWWLARTRFRGGVTLDQGLFTAGVLSFLGTFAVQMGVNVDFARYAYPVGWIGLLCFGALAVRTLTWGASLLAVVPMVGYSLNLFLPASNPLSYWPRFVADEAVYSDTTVLPGVALRWWTVRAEWSFRGACVYIPKQGAERADKVEQYFRWAVAEPKIFDETTRAEFDACPGPRVVAKRMLKSDDCACPNETSFRVARCVPQRVKDYIVYNTICLP